MYLKLEPWAGEDIKEAAATACRVHQLLGVTVEFIFNGVTLYANEHWPYDVILNNFHLAMRNNLNWSESLRKLRRDKQEDLHE